MKQLFITMAIFSAFSVQMLAQPMETAGFTLPQLLDSIEVQMETAHIPGLMFTIVTRDSVLFDGGMGTAHVGENRPVDATTLFRLGSISKSFAALCILKLESEGKFSIEDKLGEVAPEVKFSNKWEDTHPVRVVHLLEHSAGFDDMHFHAAYNRDEVEPSALEMINRHAKSLTTRWQPGTRMAYANPGYVILTHIIEKYSGMSYHDYVRQTIFEPLGMTYSNFKSFPEDFSKYAQGYAWENQNFTEVPFYAVNAGMAGTLNSCGADMAKFVQMFLNRGQVDTVQVFPREMIQKMETATSTLAASAGLRTMYALANAPSHLDKPVSFRGHNGGIDGFSSVYGYARRGYGYAISNNASGDMSKIEGLIVRYLSQGLSLVKPKKETITEGIIDTFSGYYDFKSPRNQLFAFLDGINQNINVSFTGDTLVIHRLFSSSTKYLHTGNNLYRSIDNSAATLALTYDEDQKPVLAGRFGYYEQNAYIPFQRAWFFSALAFIGIFLLFGLIWLILRLFKTVKAETIPPVLWLWLSVVGLLATTIAFTTAAQDFPSIGAVNPLTITVFVGTLLFGIGAILGVAFLFRNFRKIRSNFLRFYLLVSGIAILSFAIFLFLHGWIGLQFWSY